MRLLISAALILSTTAGAPGEGCGLETAWTYCASNSGSQVDLIGEQTSPGSGGDAGGGPAVAPEGPPPREVSDGCTLLGNPGQIDFNACLPEPAPEPGIPEVTAQDVASFAPQRPPLYGEPGGVGVVGMPTNFVTGVPAQSIGGTLFDRPVTVRFTPVAYIFAYGDGATVRTSTGGASWGDLGQAQFTATPTSHSYGARGTYTAAVTVEYAAEVDFGVGRWFPVRGVVTASTGGYPVEIYEVRTALVDKTCAENPAGPGC